MAVCCAKPPYQVTAFDATTQLPDSRHYSYDAAGRQINAIADSDPNLNQRHDYDQLDRLTGSQRGDPALSRIDYSYDLSGNRTGKMQDNTTLQSYNSNRLQSQSGAKAVSYSYDPAGNLTSDGTFSYSYNAAGRRTTATAAGQTVNYGYDAIGQRVTKTVAGNLTQFFYDEQGHLTGKYGASGQLEQEIIWLGDLPVAVLKPATSASATTDIYYIHADHLGTPRKITRPGDNRVVWSWESEAFGNSLPDQNPSGLGDFVFNLRFPGQYYDKETGLFYNYFRDYDPATGRYIESDPIGLRGGINTFVYVGGSPVNYIDPLGLDIAVIENGPTNGNPIGHTAHAVTGYGIASSENSTPIGSNLTDYLRKEVGRRDTKIYIIPTTPEQDTKAWEELKKNHKYIGLPYTYGNCSDLSNDALDKADIEETNLYPWTSGDLNRLLPGHAGARASQAQQLLISQKIQFLFLIP